MSEILIFSDSHGGVSQMECVLKKHPAAKHVLFCGDGLRDLEKTENSLKDRILVSVRGNCDGFFGADIPFERAFSLCDLSILMMHGHLLGVKGGYGVAAAYAKKRGADILIFGHTHLPYEGRLETADGSIHLFNPGSIGRGSYGVLTIRENGYLFSHGTSQL